MKFPVFNAYIGCKARKSAPEFPEIFGFVGAKMWRVMSSITPKNFVAAQSSASANTRNTSVHFGKNGKDKNCNAQLTKQMYRDLDSPSY